MKPTFEQITKVIARAFPCDCEYGGNTSDGHNKIAVALLEEFTFQNRRGK